MITPVGGIHASEWLYEAPQLPSVISDEVMKMARELHRFKVDGTPQLRLKRDVELKTETHIHMVVNILKAFGYRDCITLATAAAHDVIEDCRHELMADSERSEVIKRKAMPCLTDKAVAEALPITEARMRFQELLQKRLEKRFVAEAVRQSYAHDDGVAQLPAAFKQWAQSFSHTVADEIAYHVAQLSNSDLEGESKYLKQVRKADELNERQSVIKLCDWMASAIDDSIHIPKKSMDGLRATFSRNRMIGEKMTKAPRQLRQAFVQVMDEALANVDRIEKGEPPVPIDIEAIRNQALLHKMPSRRGQWIDYKDHMKMRAGIISVRESSPGCIDAFRILANPELRRDLNGAEKPSVEANTIFDRLLQKIYHETRVFYNAGPANVFNDAQWSRKVELKAPIPLQQFIELARSIQSEHNNAMPRRFAHQLHNHVEQVRNDHLRKLIVMENAQNYWNGRDMQGNGALETGSAVPNISFDHSTYTTAPTIIVSPADHYGHIDTRQNHKVKPSRF